MYDVDLMFDNAKAFNEDDSQIYKDADELQVGKRAVCKRTVLLIFLKREIRKVADAELKKPDSVFVMEDGRLPLPEGILHNGAIYKVGEFRNIVI